MLEQYQAQITSALTPAFAGDSSPELASAAINVCGTFIATGLVKDVDRMGRILKLLVSCLNSFDSKLPQTNIGFYANAPSRNRRGNGWGSERAQL